MKNIANADRPKSVGAMLPPRPLRRSGKVAQTACNSDRREGKSCIPTLNQTFADSRILKISKFRTFRIAAIDRKTGYLLPPSVDEWLPEKHLARFIVDVIDGLDLGRMSRAYRGTGSASYHPRTVLSILVYGYATGVFSSRKLERATWDSVAFRYIAGGEHPDHDTIATFRRRFLKDIEKLFVDVLRLAREMGVLKMGTIGLDGTKIHANASRHSALSYEHAGKIEAQLKAEVADL